MSLDTFYAAMGNVVLRDQHNNPSVFVRHPKQQSNEFDASLPAHTHPAFIVNGDEDSAVLIGKYGNSAATTADSLCSLPNRNPQAPARTSLEYINWAKAFGNNVTEMTIADHGLLVMIAHQNGYTSHGNNHTLNSDGALPHADYRSGDAWYIGASVSVGDVRIWHGWKYTCVKAHTTSSSLTPSDAPGYWRKGTKIGGVACGDGNSTYTGSGPLNWYFLDDIANESDLNGNVPMWLNGIRLYKGEIQILPDNNAADPAADTSDTSTEWKAIKPHTNDSGHDLVAPGTTGTVHYAWLNEKITLVARELEGTELSQLSKRTQFKDIVVDSTTIPTVPAILYELGLAPLPGTQVDGGVTITIDSSTYFRPHSGGYPGQSSNAGIANLNFSHNTLQRAWIGSRSRGRELA